MKSYKVLDLFSGAGGLSLGFRMFEAEGFKPFDIVGYVEIDKNAVNTLVASMERSGKSPEDAKRIVIHDDITKDETKNKLYSVCPNAEIIVGGPPCQSFSTIGPRSGDRDKQARFANDDRDDLFEHYIDIVKHYNPLFFVFENVTGLLSKKNSSGKKYINIITERLRSIGYELSSEKSIVKTGYLKLNAADYGVPQLRERVIIMGNRLGMKNPFPERTHCPKDKVGELGLLPYVTVREAISDLPPVVAKLTYTPRKKWISTKPITGDRREKIERRNRKRLNGVDPAPYHWDRFNSHYESTTAQGKKFLDFVRPAKDCTELTGHVARGQQQSDVILFRWMKEGTSSKHLLAAETHNDRRLLFLIKYRMDSFLDKYKKLSWDGLSGTIFAHMVRDGNRFIHPDGKQARTLTVREAARIQSFPDDFVFTAEGNRRYHYIGNAVPPLLARAIAGAVFKALNSKYPDDLRIEALNQI